MRKIILVLMFAILFPLTTTYAANNNLSQIKASLSQFTQDWNNGQLQNAMNIYGHSAKLISEPAIINGHSNIVAYFKKSFPTREDMGEITFSDINVKVLSSQHAMVIGKWTIQALSGKTSHGIFSLVYEKTNNGWKVILDHTSGLSS